MKITDHFTREEFACHNGTPYPLKWIDSRLFPLCKALEKIRAKVKSPITITSGYRTLGYNAKIPGAAKNSYHTKGMAADFKVAKLTGQELYDIVEKMIKAKEIPNGGLGSYKNHSFVHYDIGPAGRRWNK